jgi:hypothetical protein
MKMIMKMKLAALLVGAAVLSGAGIAQAADVTPADAQSKAAPPAMELTDTQLQTLTAGHYTGRWHRGSYWDRHHDREWGWHYYDYGPEGDWRHGLHGRNPGKHRHWHR